MQLFIITSNLVVGSFLIFAALTLRTENLRSSIMFKVIPFMGGASLIFSGLKLLNII